MWSFIPPEAWAWPAWLKYSHCKHFSHVPLLARVYVIKFVELFAMLFTYQVMLLHCVQTNVTTVPGYLYGSWHGVCCLHTKYFQVIIGGPFSPDIEQILRDRAFLTQSPVISACDPGIRSITKCIGWDCGKPYQSCDIVIEISNDIPLV